MKPKWRGWKEGIITEDLQSGGSAMANKPPEHRKGDRVRYKRHKEYDSESDFWTGKYEWHYLDLNNYNLVRTSEFLIKE